MESPTGNAVLKLLEQLKHRIEVLEAAEAKRAEEHVQRKWWNK